MSNKNYRIYVENYEIKSIDILHFTTDLKIFVSEKNRLLYRNDNIINNASKYGHVQVLEWFKNSGCEFKYDVFAIYYASFHGRVQVLEWFKNSGYKFKYNEWAINEASKNEHNNILKFFSNKINIKKLIKWLKKIIFIKTIKFKSRNKYLKGYQKN